MVLFATNISNYFYLNNLLKTIKYLLNYLQLHGEKGSQAFLLRTLFLLIILFFFMHFNEEKNLFNTLPQI